MIVFDLDDCLADCEHRRHFIQKPWDHCHKCYEQVTRVNPINQKCECGRDPFSWQENWKSFYEACDKDIPIEPVMKIFSHVSKEIDVQIWSGRCESVRQKTIDWFFDKWFIGAFEKPLKAWIDQILKMRPIGNTEPDDKLKEMWLHDAKILEGKTIDFVFEDRKKVCDIWRRHGIFVFNCCQHDEEF